MKKSLAFGILGLAATAITSYGQGYITLDNYASMGPLLTYEDGSLLGVGWTVGFYWAPGTTGLSQAGGTDMPDASLTLATGPGSTAAVAGPEVFGQAGYYSSFPAFNSGSTLNTTLTLEIVVYPTAAGGYAQAMYRVHSAAFTMPTVSATSGSPAYTGSSMPGQLSVMPEPGALTLAGLGGLTLWLIRRKKT